MKSTCGQNKHRAHLLFFSGPRTALPAFVLLLLSLNACKDEVEQIPAYLDLQPFTVQADWSTSYHKITEGWLYVDGEYLGAYSLPAKVPVLNAGVKEVLLYPGVRENGQLETPNIYPFLKVFDKDVDLKAGETITVNPVTSYDIRTKYLWDAEQANFNASSIGWINLDNDPSTSVQLTSNGAFNGRCTFLKVDETSPLMEIGTEPFLLPSDQFREIWMELHYQANVPFDLFIYGVENNGTQDSQPIFKFNFKETDGYNKIYFSLGGSVFQTQRPRYRLRVKAAYPSNSSLGAGEVRLDNLQILYF